MSRLQRRPRRETAAVRPAVFLSTAADHLRAGRLADALAALDAALRVDANLPEAEFLRGLALSGLGRAPDAVTAFERAVRLRPDYVGAQANLGATLNSLGRATEAVAACEAALRLRPDLAEAHLNRAAALITLDRAEEALAGCEAALRCKPDFAEAQANRSEALRKLGRAVEALSASEAALALKPTLAVAHNNRGAALRELGRPEEAFTAFDAAIRLAPDYADAHSNRGAALMDLGRLDEALAAFERALALKPDHAEAYQNAGGAYLRLNQPNRALAACDAAIRAQPGQVRARAHRGDALWVLGRIDEAIDDYRAAERLAPTASDVRFNRALLTLLSGDLANGWSDYERRWEIKEAPRRALNAPFPVWRGEDLGGKSILVYEEQGLGDVIQFSRYLRRLCHRGAQVTFLAPKKLVALLRTLEGEIDLRTSAPESETFDFQCPLLSLPLGFATTLETIPSTPRYLSAEPERVELWRRRLGEGGFRIGIAWQGNRASPVEQGRSFPLAGLSGLARLPGVRLVSLQKYDGCEQLNDLPAGMEVETLGNEFDAGPDAFLDTAAVMESLDLVISSDTAVAHLAGALGRPVWLSLKQVPEWRWQLNRPDSPWYPTMRLFRQTTRNDWRHVFAAMEAALAQEITV